MAQAIDMRRLHMGCGEPLQSHLPVEIGNRWLQRVLLRVVIERRGAAGAGDRKRKPTEDRCE